MTNSITDPLVDGHEEGLDTPEVEVDVTLEGIATVLINRPGAQNALNWDAVEALSEAFETLHAADGVSVVFLRGAGGTFCGGVDPEWLLGQADDGKTEERTLVDEIARMLKRLWDMPAVTVALVEGAALGGGAWLASACDVVVAAPDAAFNWADPKLAATSALISPYVAEARGETAAKQLFADDRIIDARAAQELGLVQELASDAAALDATARRIAAMVAGGERGADLSLATSNRIAGAQAEARDLVARARPNWAVE